MPGTENISSFERDRKPASRIRRSSAYNLVVGVLALTLIISLAQCISVNFYRSMEHDELMTYSQSPQDVRVLMEKIEGFNKGPENLRIAVVDPQSLYWPLPWYFRDYEKAEYYTTLPGNGKYDAIIVPAAYQMYKEIPEERYALYNFSLRPGKELTLYYEKSLESGER